MGVNQKLCQALVIEDDPTISSLLQTILRRERFLVDAVRTGAQALERIAAQPYHLLVVDLMLPETHGRQVIDYLRSHRLEQLKTVIVVSADASAIRDGYPEPICKFLAKPFDVEEFVRHVHECKDHCDHQESKGRSR